MAEIRRLGNGCVLYFASITCVLNLYTCVVLHFYILVFLYFCISIWSAGCAGIFGISLDPQTM